ncbi:TRAP transporter substrate-binding protein [Salibacterium sp. K-3]
MKRKSVIFLMVVFLISGLIMACGLDTTEEDSSSEENDGSSNEGSSEETSKGSADQEAEYTFEMANVLPEDDVTGHGLNKFAEIVHEKSDGNIEIQISHGGQLGSGVETFEAVQNGNLDFAADSFANLATITDAFEIFHLPFLFESRQQALSAMNSEVVQERVNEDLSETELKWFSTMEIGGPREIGTSNKKVESIEDLEGMTFRASRSPLEIAAQEAWGAQGQTVDWPETPESVRLGMVDGLTVPYASFYSADFHEGDLINYMADVNFQWYSLVTVVNDEMWQELPEDVRKILNESIEEAEEWHVDFVADYITENINEMREAGVEIYSWDEAEYEELKQVTKDEVWGEFVGKPGISQEKLDLIQEEMGPVGDGGWGYKISE